VRECQLTSSRGGRSPRIAFVFNSRESLGTDLWAHLTPDRDPVRSSLERSDAAIRRHLGWSLFDHVSCLRDDNELLRAEHVIEPALTAIQIALADTWFHHGVIPEGVAGRSAGEFAAGYARGALSHAGAIELACRVSEMIRGGESAGHVLLVSLAPEAVLALKARAGAPFYVIADGRAKGTFVACAKSDLTEVVALLEAHAETVRVEPISVAAHTPLMDAFAERFLAPLSSHDVPERLPIPGFSSTTGQQLESSPGHEYFWSAIRDPVQIRAMFRTMALAEFDTFIEVGGRSSLASLISQGAADVDRSVVAYPSMRSGECRLTTMHETAAAIGHLDKFTEAGSVIRLCSPAGSRVERNALLHAIEQGLHFLSSQQLESGEFHTLLGSRASLEDGVPDSSPFVTSLLAYSLRAAGPPALPLIERALDFLSSEREAGGVWRYYSSQQFKHRRVPPDLDDTACCSFALRVNGRAVPNNAWMLLANRDSTGRFGTWMIPTPRTGLRFRLLRTWGDLLAMLRTPSPPAVHHHNPRFARPKDPVHPDEFDAVVNANVVLYLGDVPGTRAAVEELRRIVIEDRAGENSIYYPHELSLYYAIARAADNGVRAFDDLFANIADRVRAKVCVSDLELSPLTSALGAATLLSVAPSSPELAHCLRFIVDSQQANGAWRREAYYRGPAEFWGSDELTTGFALEALARYQGSVLRT